MGKFEKHADEIMDEIYNDWGPSKGLEIEEELSMKIREHFDEAYQNAKNDDPDNDAEPSPGLIGAFIDEMSKEDQDKAIRIIDSFYINLDDE